MKHSENKYDIANEKIFNWIRGIWVCGALIFFIFVLKPFEDKVPVINKKLQGEYIFGTVNKKYIDYKNHAAMVIEVSGKVGQIDLWHFPAFYEQINLGDNVLKNTNDSIFYIIKSDTIISFDYQI